MRCVLFSRSIGSGWAKISRLVHLISKNDGTVSTFGSSCGNFLLSRWCVVNDDEIVVRVMPKRLQRLQIAVIVRDYKFTFDCTEFFHETAELVGGRILRRGELVKRRREMR